MNIQEIFQSEEFNYLSLDELKNKYVNNRNFQKLIELKNICYDLISGPSQFKKNMLDCRGNKIDGWSENEKRGNRNYESPIGWIGIGLKVMNCYDCGNNNWLGKNNLNGEWNVAYHAVGYRQSSDIIKKIIGIIFRAGFKPGLGQMHANCDDINHSGKKVGNGIYVTPSISTAEAYAGVLEINGLKYKTVLMVRVKPEAVRECNCGYGFWVVNETSDEIRLYRILFKRCD